MAVSAKNFRFISPGIRIEEIDRSQIPADEPAIGACVIGRAARGRAFTPVEVRSFSDFVAEFGEPVAGGNGGDVWREGNYTSPMYATYAAQSWLRNGEALTFVRTLGVKNSAVGETDTGAAGWRVGTADFNSAASETEGGAYALVVFPSSSTGALTGLKPTGSVAAIFYMGDGAPVLTGSNADASTTRGSSELIKSTGGELVVQFSGSIDGVSSTGKYGISFSKGKSNFIRKVFNTDPTLIGRSSTTNGKINYFLGETFETTYEAELTGTNSTTSEVFGAIVGLGGFSNAGAAASDIQGHDVRKGALESNSYSKSGWFLSQDLSSDTGSWSSTTSANLTAGRLKKLFRFVGLDAGEWTQNNIKVSLANIRAPINEDVDPYATFTVQLRQIQDSDDNVKIVESFEGCNLNPNSDNYLLRRVGTRFSDYDYTKGRIIEKGEFPNNSKYVRVETAAEFSDGFSADYVPFGVTGPTKFISTVYGTNQLIDPVDIGVLRGAGSAAFGNAFGSGILSGSGLVGGLKINFPSAPTRANTDSLLDYRQAYFGVQTTTDGGSNFKADIRDLVRSKPRGVNNQYDADLSDILEFQYVVSLEDLTFKDQTAVGAVGVGSSSFLDINTSARAGGYSLTTTGTLPSGFNGGPSADLQSYKVVLNAGAGNLTTLFFGGTDGFDITQSDPLANVNVGSSETVSYEFNSFERAINTVKNPEVVSYNVVSIPGLENTTLVDTLITNTEDRADALAVFDIDKGYVPPHEFRYGGDSESNGNVVEAINSVKTQKYNSSYAATYYPWVKIRDNINAKDVWVPPSIAALGAMSYTDRIQAPWFAPAGFNRGGLSSGVSGLPVVSTALKLFKDDRDDLYEVGVNPIATFPNEGVVIFGQKTLQVERSALDRINVRRLMIFLKRGISRISNRILFEPNVPDTWNNFKNQAIPFLTDVKTRFGLTDYKLVLDETTTTPDLIDRNILYAKLFIKPARAIEYIALDFIITNTGASFDD